MLTQGGLNGTKNLSGQSVNFEHTLNFLRVAVCVCSIHFKDCTGRGKSSFNFIFMVHWCRLGLPHPVHLMLRDLSDCISVARKAIVLTTPTAMSKPNVRRLLGIRKKLFSAVLSAPCSQNCYVCFSLPQGKMHGFLRMYWVPWQYHQLGVVGIPSLPSLIWYINVDWCGGNFGGFQG